MSVKHWSNNLKIQNISMGLMTRYERHKTNLSWFVQLVLADVCAAIGCWQHNVGATIKGLSSSYAALTF